jgi:LDH2 family malate/lactate/ureidoglycolate dehydrogenase
LRAFAAAIFEKVGVPADHAADAADVLVWANLSGVDTHGLRNLKRAYVDNIVAGIINPKPEFRIEFETPITARVDGDNGLGLAGGCWAMRLAIAKAAQSGIGLVAVHNSHHYGAAGYFSKMALPHDMIGLSMTGYLRAGGGTHGVIPTFGAVPMLSTNPIAMAAPADKEAPFMLDMATTISPMNRVWLYHELGKSIPLGWGVDEHLQDTTDPTAVRGLMPLGGTREQGSHKGYGLAVMVEILCGLLSGAWARGEDGKYRQDNNGHFFAALRLDYFLPPVEFKAAMDGMIDELHRTPAAPGYDRVLVAGDPEHATRLKRGVEGIPLAANVVEDLRTLSAQYGVPLSLE